MYLKIVELLELQNEYCPSNHVVSSQFLAECILYHKHSLLKKLQKNGYHFFNFILIFVFVKLNRDNIENIYLKNHHESNYELGYGLFQLIQWHEQKRFLCYLQF